MRKASILTTVLAVTTLAGLGMVIFGVTGGWWMFIISLLSLETSVYNDKVSDSIDKISKRNQEKFDKVQQEVDKLDKKV